MPVVGQGISDRMKVESDTPLSDETYVSPDWSIAVGSLGLYVYSKASNTVVLVSTDTKRALIELFRSQSATAIILLEALNGR